jgi:hypothetical protein
VTTLYCPRCRKRRGDAKLRDVDVVHVSVVVQRRRGAYSGRTVHLTRGRTLRLDDPDGWPLDWRCEQCHDTTVRLTSDRARRVGHAKRLVVDSMPDR